MCHHGFQNFVMAKDLNLAYTDFSIHTKTRIRKLREEQVERNFQATIAPVSCRGTYDIPGNVLRQSTRLA